MNRFITMLSEIRHDVHNVEMKLAVLYGYAEAMYPNPSPGGNPSSSKGVPAFLAPINDKPISDNQNGDALTIPEDSQMLIKIPGVSINAKPRKDGRYQGYISREGEKKYFYGKTQEEVAAKMQYYFQEVNTQKRKTAKKKTPLFGEYVDTWLELYKKPNLKPISIVTIQNSLKPALEAFQSKQISSVTADEIQSVLIEMNGKRMREMCLANLNQIFSQAVKKGIVKNNPCAAVEIKKYKYGRKHALTIEEQKVFHDAAEATKYAVLYQLLLSTGLRIGEALALQKSDVDFEKRTIKITKNVVFVDGQRIVQETPKTEAGNRIVPISASLCERLRAIETETLFPYTYNSVRIATNRIGKKYGIPVSLHILRHTFATRMEEAGIPPKIKQYLLGHSSIGMTQNVYTDAQQSYVESVSDRIRELF